jgi:hypothetical protein
VLNPLYVTMIAAQAAGTIDFDARPGIRPRSDLNLG